MISGKMMYQYTHGHNQVPSLCRGEIYHRPKLDMDTNMASDCVMGMDRYIKRYPEIIERKFSPIQDKKWPRMTINSSTAVCSDSHIRVFTKSQSSDSVVLR